MTDMALTEFTPIHFRPIPVKTAGLKYNQIFLDGDWRINPAPSDSANLSPLSSEEWHDFRVPGQWLQQGFDVPQDQPVAVAKEFEIPKEWAGYRVFLRFDAVHAGAHYALNGQKLGYSENLFTPIEWEITDSARPGQMNRLDLRMTVATASERLSTSSSYAGHNLGGIDRSVRIYALPKLHISRLRLSTDLDSDYRDAELLLDFGLDNSEAAELTGATLSIQLYDAGGDVVAHSAPKLALEPLKAGPNAANTKSLVPNPLKWNSEQPNLYRLALELSQGGNLLERIERNVGFRKIEIKGRQFYINGRRVKLAGVCRHEIDPLTGRADTMRHAEEDVKLFKAANLNHLRTSHYPCTQELLDAADRLGFYVEAEAPFCWVGLRKTPEGEADLLATKEVLTPTSAMVDYFHAHPSVIIWSLSNESHWSDLFDVSNKLCKQLDPTRPTTVSGPLPHNFQVPPFPIPENCDILNRHYINLPYDGALADDPRPFLHGECFFELYHERAEVAINPGIRELWSHGNVEPDSDWGKYCAQSFAEPLLWPGVQPGAWSHIYASERLIGSEIWSGIDDIAFLPDGQIVSSEKGNAYWGIIDGWRRPKPEWWLSKLIFSPVWIPVFAVEYTSGQTLVRVPVENRYSFTDLSELGFSWELAGKEGKVSVTLAPGSKGEIRIPVPTGTSEGDTLVLRVTDKEGITVNARTIRLGRRNLTVVKASTAAPQWSDDGQVILIKGKGFSLVIDRTTGDFDTTDPRHTGSLLSIPALHVTQYECEDLVYFQKRSPKPYAQFPDANTRVVKSLSITECSNGLEITIHDQYDHFVGSVRWLIDNDGAGTVAYDYNYTGDNIDTREVGLKFSLRPEYDEVKWQRWSEWGIFPEDHISRTEGRAKARRDEKWGNEIWSQAPAWPWSLDQTELGTNDFRSIKFNIHEASLSAADGSEVRAEADGDVHFRACLAENGVKMHLLSRCPLGPVVLKKDDRLTGKFILALRPQRSSQ